MHESPVRVHDSRSEPQRELVVGETRTVDLQLPAGARAALVIVTVDQTEGSGYLTLYAADTPLPATNIDWSETGEVIATSSTVNVDDEGRINITAGHDATHFIVGVTGYVMCAVQFVVANPIGVATDATRSLAALGAVALAALIVAALLALGPGWSATRRRPADALKVE